MFRRKLYSLLTNPLFAFFFIFLFALLSFTRQMTNDEGIWSYIGRVWVNNHILPYRGSIENKPLGIFNLYAASYFLFGVNTLFVRILSIISCIFSTYFVYKITKKIYSKPAGIFSSYFFIFISFWDQFDGMYKSCTETFMITFSLLSIWIILKTKESKASFLLLLSGLFIGIAINFKQIAVFDFLVFLILIINSREKSSTIKRSIFFYLIGFILAFLLFLIQYNLCGGSVSEFVSGSWAILLNKGSSAPSALRLSRFFHTWFTTGFLTLYAILLCFFINKKIQKNRHFNFLCLWLIVDFIAVNASGYSYGHQLQQLLPVFSIMCGIAIVEIFPGLNLHEANNSHYNAIILCCGFLLFFPLKVFYENGKPTFIPEKDGLKEIGKWLKANTSDKDYIYIYGRNKNAILSYSERMSSSRYFNNIFMVSDYERNIVYNDLQLHKPVYFIIYTPDFQKMIQDFGLSKINIADFLKRDYIFFEEKNNFLLFKQLNQ